MTVSVYFISFLSSCICFYLVLSCFHQEKTVDENYQSTKWTLSQTELFSRPYIPVRAHGKLCVIWYHVSRLFSVSDCFQGIAHICTEANALILFPPEGGLHSQPFSCFQRSSRLKFSVFLWLLGKLTAAAAVIPLHLISSTVWTSIPKRYQSRSVAVWAFHCCSIPLGSPSLQAKWWCLQMPSS